MDFAPPVAQNVNVNPNQGLQTLSGILGLKQQQLALQTGQAQLGTAQAQEQQEQQTASQRQHIAGLMQNFDPEQHIGPDGTLDLNGIFADPDLRSAFGDQFPAFMQTMQQMKNNQLQAKQQLLTLNNDSRVQFEQMVGGLRTDPDVIADNSAGRQKVQTAIGQFASSGPDAARAAQTYGSVFQSVPQGKLAQAVSNAQLQSLDASAQAAHQAPTFQNTGAALVPTNPQAAGGSLGPTPGTQGTPPITVAPGPAGAAPYQAGIAAATGAASARATGTAGIDLGRAAAVSNAVQQSSAMIPVTHEIDSLADQVVSGKFAQAISQAAANVHMTAETYARQLLVKDLGQVRSAAIKGAPSVEAADTVLTGFPESTSDPQTIHTSMDLVRGSFQQNLDRGQQLQAFRQKDPTLTGFAQADDQLTSSRTPYQSEFRTLPKGPMRQAFLQRHFQTPEQAQAFVNSIPP